MKKIMLIACLIPTFAFAMSYPEFNKARKMKPKEVFDKCAELAQKEIKDMKDGTDAEKAKRSDAFQKFAHGCSLKNGFDAKGDQGNLNRIADEIKKGVRH